MEQRKRVVAVYKQQLRNRKLHRIYRFAELCFFFGSDQVRQ